MPGGREDEFDFLLHGDGLERRGWDGRVSGSDQGVTVPGNCEQHAAIAGVRNHNRAFTLQEARIEDQVNALAGNDHRRDGRLRLEPKQIAESAGGVDHNLRGGAKFVAGFDIAGADSVYKSLSVLGQSRDFDIVQQRGALLESGGHHVNEQPGVVELSIVINCAAAQAFGLQCRQMFERLFAGKNA